MDPLTITAAVVGMIASASKMIPTLVTFITTVQDAPKLAQEVLTELQDITAAAEMLQSLVLNHAETPHSRAHFIQLESLTTVLAGCVTAYSKLEPKLNTLGNTLATGAWNRTKWLFKQGELERIVGRLQNYKASLSLMLNILQCISIAEVYDSVSRLGSLVGSAIRMDNTLSNRARILTYNLDDSRSTVRSNLPRVSIGSADSEAGDVNDDDDNAATIRPRVFSAHGAISADVSLRDRDQLSHDEGSQEYWKELFDSGVYQRVHFNADQFSLISSRRGSHLAPRSIASAISLDQVSKLSLVAINIVAQDLSNSQRYWSHEEHSPVTTETILYQIKAAPRPRLSRRDAGRVPIEQQARSIGDPQSTHRVLGVPLGDAIAHASSEVTIRNEHGCLWHGIIPNAIIRPGVYLRTAGKRVDLDYRYPSQSDDRTTLRLVSIFEQGPDFGRDADLSKFQAKDMIDFLRAYLSDMPDTVIPSATCRDWHIAYWKRYKGGAEGNINIFPDQSTLISLIYQLPLMNQGVLLYLLILFSDMAFHMANVHMSGLRDQFVWSIFSVSPSIPIRQSDLWQYSAKGMLTAMILGVNRLSHPWNTEERFNKLDSPLISKTVAT